MLKEKSIVDLCLVGLKKECIHMLRCDSLEISSSVVTFDDLQKPIIVHPIFMNENIGYKQTYECNLKEDEETGQLMVNLTKLNKNLH